MTSKTYESSEAMREVNRILDRVAGKDNKVLFQGAFGTGKQFLARELHDRSPRRHAPFNVLHCSALTPEQLSDEVIGRDGHAGTSIFARSQGGTVHLAEVHELPLPLQARLVYLLENDLDLGCRLICSSVMDMGDQVRKRKFLEKLYYLVSVVTVVLPQLRDRREDLPMLVDRFLLSHSARSGSAVALSETARYHILSYTWPGNVAELRHALEHACALCAGGIIKPEDLPLRMTQPQALSPSSTGFSQSQDETSLPIGQTLDEFVEAQSKRFIHETLRFNRGSREKTISMLGISVSTLYRKLDLRARHTHE
ncbi:MAG: sigma-54-dependent transcriptional regulator [Verrucomicrobium sp.]|nr:sigma 54-interacting transcriptional regulator [Verrucomicrobium sp.]